MRESVVASASDQGILAGAAEDEVAGPEVHVDGAGLYPEESMTFRTMRKRATILSLFLCILRESSVAFAWWTAAVPAAATQSHDRDRLENERCLGEIGPFHPRGYRGNQGSLIG